MMSRERVSESRKDRRALIVVGFCVVASLQMQILFSDEKATLAPETESKMVRTGSSLSGFHLYGDVSEEVIEDGIEAEGLEYDDSVAEISFLGYPVMQYSSVAKEVREGLYRDLEVLVKDKSVVSIRNTYDYKSKRLCQIGYEAVNGLIREKTNPFSNYENKSYDLREEYVGKEDILEVANGCHAISLTYKVHVTLRLKEEVADSFLGENLQTMYQSHLFPVMSLTTIIDNHQEG